MANVTRNHDPDQHGKDHRHSIVKAVLFAAGGFGSTLVTMLMVSGQWDIAAATTRFAMTVFTIVVAIAMFVAAVYVWPHQR